MFDSKVIEWLDSMKNQSTLIREIVTKFHYGKLSEDSKENLTRRKLLADIAYKEIMVKIKKQELLHSETFETPPTPQAKTAIKAGVNTESYEPPEEKKIKEVIETNWNRFVETLKQNSKGEWTLTCKLCSTGFILPSKESAIERFKKHLTETHYERVLE